MTTAVLPQVFYPWRRYFARTLDLFIYSTFWSIFLALAFHVNLTGRSNLDNLFDFFIASVMMLFLEPLLLHWFGTTLGKLLFGLKLESPDGRRLSYEEALKRTWGAFGSGLGYHIPIYSLVRLWKSYKLCRAQEVQPWDADISYTIRDTKWYRGALFIAAYAAGIALLAVVISAQQLPPNRGNLTVAELVENHHYYENFFEVGFGNQRLEENGTWTEKGFDGTAYASIWSEPPEYHYTIENGYVTGVSFQIEQTDPQDWIDSYDTQMTLLSLSMVGAQKEIGPFSKAPSRIVNQIYSAESFHITESGIEIICNLRYSGFLDIQSDFYIPDDTAEETYFNLEFSIKKLT